MSSPGWRFAFAYVVGTSHLRSGSGCQDRCDCRLTWTTDGDPVLVAVVADKAGSADRGEVGAQLACSLLVDELFTLFDSDLGLGEVTHPFVRGWLVRFQGEVQRRADAEGLLPRDFACTVVAALVGPTSARFFPVGDGATVVSLDRSPGSFECVFWPQQGDYENVTSFATDPRTLETFEFASLYSPRHRLAHFPDASWQFLVHAAANAARAIASLHEHGHVVGDIDHSNLMVSPQATAKLIDCDSFQVAAGGKRYLCEVGALFLRAFAPQVASGTRPAPTEWVPALEGLAKSLQTCPRNSGHRFYSGLAVCPWCEIERHVGKLLFNIASVAAQTVGTATNVLAAWAQIQAVRAPEADRALPDRRNLAVQPSPGVLAYRQGRQSRAIAAVAVTAVVCLAFLVAGSGLWLFALALG